MTQLQKVPAPESGRHYRLVPIYMFTICAIMGAICILSEVIALWARELKSLDWGVFVGGVILCGFPFIGKLHVTSTEVSVETADFTACDLPPDLREVQRSIRALS